MLDIFKQEVKDFQTFAIHITYLSNFMKSLIVTFCWRKSFDVEYCNFIYKYICISYVNSIINVFRLYLY